MVVVVLNQVRDAFSSDGLLVSVQGVAQKESGLLVQSAPVDTSVDPFVPMLGVTWTACVNTRLRLRASSITSHLEHSGVGGERESGVKLLGTRSRSLRVVFSPYLCTGDEALFGISEGGLVG
jgi:hypothetical protein